MDLGARLNTYIEQHDRKQSEVAVSWLEQWTGRGGKSWSDQTINSNLSRLLNNQPQGVRFFFQDRARGLLLFEILQVPQGDHPELFELADRSMKTEGAPARIVVDATSWGVAHADVMFAELKRLLIPEGPYPIALVILNEQYDKLPRSFDDYKDKVRYVRVEDAEKGWERAQELAEEHGLVISSHRFPEFERWLAADFDGRVLRVEPRNGLESFRTQGRLPGLEPVTHDLTKLVPEGANRYAVLPSAGCDLHVLMRALRSEAESMRLSLSMRGRQSMALALGITATSTARERTEALLGALERELPVKIQSVSPDDFKAHLLRAERRRTGPLALQVEDKVHLLNVPEATRLTEGRPWVQLHDIQPAPTALGRLLEAVKDWNEFDFLADPFLEHLLSRLDPEEKERTAFLHARAGLLLTQALCPQPVAPLRDWKPALEELLACEPPAALLRVRMQGKKIKYAHRERAAFLVTEARAQRVKEAPNMELHQVPPLADLLLSRGDEPLVVGGGSLHEQDRWAYRRHWVPSILLPNEPQMARDTEFWLDLFEACDFKSDLWQELMPTVWEQSRHRVLPGNLVEWTTGALSLPDGIWEESDQELAMSWLALRLALASPQAIRLHDGAILMRLGGAFFAELRLYPLTSRPAGQQVQGSLLLDVEFEQLFQDSHGTRRMSGKVHSLSDLVTTHTVKGGYDFGARLPKRIHILGERYFADIRFRGSALFSESSQSMSYAAAVARIEDEKHEADDDSDDHDE